MVKRVEDLDETQQRVLLAGDNQAESWRGWVPAAAMEGKVVALVWRGRIPQTSAVVKSVSARKMCPMPMDDEEVGRAK
jgi:hypothetical protein